MFLVELINKRPAIDALAEKHFNNFATVKAIYSLRKKVQEEYDFYLTEEKKLIEQYVEKDENGNPKIENGYLQFKTQEDKENYIELITNLSTTEVAIDKITIKANDFRDELPTPKELNDLDVFVDWQ